jgi:hypothetical protein
MGYYAITCQSTVLRIRPSACCHQRGNVTVRCHHLFRRARRQMARPVQALRLLAHDLYAFELLPASGRVGGASKRPRGSHSALSSRLAAFAREPAPPVRLGLVLLHQIGPTRMLCRRDTSSSAMTSRTVGLVNAAQALLTRRVGNRRRQHLQRRLPRWPAAALGSGRRRTGALGDARCEQPQRPQ